MMRALIAAATLVLSCLAGALTVGSASAVCGGGSGTSTSATSGGNAFSVGATSSSEGCTAEVDIPAIHGEWHSEPMCELGGRATCESIATCADGSVQQHVYFVADDGTEFDGGTSCADDATEPVEISEGMVLNALRQIPLPPSELIVQPPNGRTLVNFETNFYTQDQPLDRTIRLLGQRVDLRIWPDSYRWRFGDGATSATESAGAPYPDLEITHSYTTKGTVGPAVDTTYAAEFRVNGRAWRSVPGTVTIPGNSVDLEVVEATPTLVGYH